MLFCLRTGVTAFLVALAAVMPPTLAQQPRSTTSAVTSDPPRDLKYPAADAGPQIAVRGSHINGYLMVASGAGPHPTVLLLHGFPGYEGLLDVGEALRRAGINVLAIHYRGDWGSGGTFTFGGSVDDAEAAIGWLKDPKTAARYRIDTNRIYAIGHSFGGFVAMMLAARTHDVKAIAYISGWDIVSDASPWLAKPTQAAIDDYEQSARKYGTTTGANLVQEVVDHARDYTLVAVAPKVADRPILITYAEFEEEDNSPRRNSEPLRAALKSAGAASVQTRVFATDHGYSDTRIALAYLLIDWLSQIQRGRQ